jgi:hypothetical protein
MREWAIGGRILAMVLLAGLTIGCEKEIEAIVVDEGLLVVNNRTPSAWSNVEIWLNDHYRITVPKIAAGERFSVRLENFSAAYARRFDPKRQSVTGIELTARAGDNTPVKIVWGQGRRW